MNELENIKNQMKHLTNSIETLLKNTGKCFDEPEAVIELLTLKYPHKNLIANNIKLFNETFEFYLELVKYSYLNDIDNRSKEKNKKLF